MNSVMLSQISATEKCAAETNPPTSSDNIPRRDSTFLVLTPVMSPTYPSQPALPATTSPLSPPVGSVTSPIIEPIKKARRSSSISSTSSFTKRYLKLGPVHGGGDPGITDYVDIDEE